MSAREIITDWLRTHTRFSCGTAADELIAALRAAGMDIVAQGEDHKPTWDRALERGATHLTQIEDAMWQRCEVVREAVKNEVTAQERNDAVTAWCFGKAADAIRSLKDTGGERG